MKTSQIMLFRKLIICMLKIQQFVLLVAMREPFLCARAIVWPNVLYDIRVYYMHVFVRVKSGSGRH